MKVKYLLLEKAEHGQKTPQTIRLSNQNDLGVERIWILTLRNRIEGSTFFCGFRSGFRSLLHTSHRHSGLLLPKEEGPGVRHCHVRQWHRHFCVGASGAVAHRAVLVERSSACTQCLCGQPLCVWRPAPANHDQGDGGGGDAASRRGETWLVCNNGMWQGNLLPSKHLVLMSVPIQVPSQWIVRTRSNHQSPKSSNVRPGTFLYHHLYCQESPP